MFGQPGPERSWGVGRNVKLLRNSCQLQLGSTPQITTPAPDLFVVSVTLGAPQMCPTPALAVCTSS